MKAAVYTGSKGLDIRDVPTPQLEEEGVLIRVVACGLCHTDLHYIDHGVPTHKKPPITLGHEAAGTISAVGRKVTTRRVGDRVLIPAVLTCGACGLCRSGRSNICSNMRMLGNHVDGAFAEYVAVRAQDTFLLPSEIPLEEASVLADAVSTAYHAVINRGRVGPGMQVVVFGCGGVGINVIQMARTRGARVTAVDTKPDKLELAMQFGATEAIDAAGTFDMTKRIRMATEGGADVAFECIGNPTTIGRAHDCVRRGGRLCIVGYSDRPAPIEVARVMFFEQDIVGSLGCPTEDFPRVIELVQLKKIRTKGLVSAAFSLDRIEDALEALRAGRGLRNVVTP